MKKKLLPPALVLLAAGVVLSAAALLFRSPSQNPVQSLAKPFSCTVTADAGGFVFAFDLSRSEDALHLTLTQPKSLQGIEAVADSRGVSLYKDRLPFARAGSNAPGIQTLCKALLSPGSYTLTRGADGLIAEGGGSLSGVKITFDRRTLAPVSVSCKGGAVTAKISNFRPADD